MSLPIFPDMREDEIAHVTATVKAICLAHRKSPVRALEVRS